jgi:hypothetical protein
MADLETQFTEAMFDVYRREPSSNEQGDDPLIDAA